MQATVHSRSRQRCWNHDVKRQRQHGTCKTLRRPICDRFCRVSLSGGRRPVHIHLFDSLYTDRCGRAGGYMAETCPSGGMPGHWYWFSTEAQPGTTSCQHPCFFFMIVFLLLVYRTTTTAQPTVAKAASAGGMPRWANPVGRGECRGTSRRNV